MPTLEVLRTTPVMASPAFKDELSLLAVLFRSTSSSSAALTWARLSASSSCEELCFWFWSKLTLMGFTLKPNKLFTEEVFGAEISGMRNWKMGFLPGIRYAMKPDEAYGLVFSWDNVVAVVSEENDMESIAHCFLSAAVRVNANPNQFSLRDVVEKFRTLSDRKPSKCVVFEDDPSDITAAHNCTMMAGSSAAPRVKHPALERRAASAHARGFTIPRCLTLREPSSSLFVHAGTAPRVSHPELRRRWLFFFVRAGSRSRIARPRVGAHRRLFLARLRG
ncbi:hypothetical protein DY000_02043471 [Brassica cretica]|uniref:Uncharacterized protein n=1 Tax=Brassica cretica TaxID=69181 RepID=A0ABQ7BR66_BRACR|nr:hypothetical protein DY000_02043471 [Brassica cretica]